MKISGLFIGIDKHFDPTIRELYGAHRDALALWCLFTDTIKGINSHLLVNTEATLEKIKNNLDLTLGSAGPDDTIIISFSGHGTNNHRIVCHDTTKNKLNDSTLAMSELAERIKSSKAARILVILDCCFSGGATARVLDDSPISRDSTGILEMLAGKGRFIIAASNINEPAYEFPDTRHGILTQALIEVFCGAKDSINVQSAMDEIMEKVRTESLRIGVKQTPVALGKVEGGFILPNLKAGNLFSKNFPELKSENITNDILTLSKFGIPDVIIEEWSRAFSQLNQLQVTAVNKHRILDGKSLLVVAPTSSGKTFIGEMASIMAFLQGKKAVFLLPYRALVNEKFNQFSIQYGERLSMRVIRCSGDYADKVSEFVRGKYDLAILTYEMFLNISVSSTGVLNQIGLVVLDEAQFITDPTRGISVELLLTLLSFMKEKGINPQLIALSAVIGNVNNFDQWLNVDKLVITERPIPLTEGVMDRNGIFQFLDPTGKRGQIQLVNDIYQRKEKPSSQDQLVPLLKHLTSTGEKVIIFRNIKGVAQGCAKYLANELGLPPAIEAIKELPTLDLPSTSIDLKECLQGGTAFHNTNLTREEKEVVEKWYREPNGIRVLAATTTLAAGINTPASTVILAEQEFVGDDGRPFTVAEYKNMVGRAGRLGFNEEGKSIILAENQHDRQRLFQKYVLGTLEELSSSFDPSNLNTWIIRLLSQIKRIPKDDMVKLLVNTYGGYNASRSNPNWESIMSKQLSDLSSKMLSLGLIEEENEYVQLTLLGKACGASSLTFDSSMRLVNLIRTNKSQINSAEDLMCLVQVLRESDNGYTPVMKRGQSEAVRIRECAERYGTEMTRILQTLAGESYEYYGRCKRASILWDWINGIPVDEIEKRYTANPFQGKIGHGEIRRFADATRFHLRSAFEIMSTMVLKTIPSEESVSNLIMRLEVGLPTKALGLLSIPIQFSRGEYLALHQKNINSRQELLSADKQLLSNLVSDSHMYQLNKLKTS